MRFNDDELEEYIVIKAIRDYNHCKFSSTELFLMEGVGAQEWYDELEASKFVMEETRPYQYEGYYANLKEDMNTPAPVPEISLPSFSLTAGVKLMIASSLSLIVFGT